MNDRPIDKKEKISLGGKEFTEGMREEYDLRPGGMKSRGNFRVGVCLKNCANRGEKCKTCIRFSNLKEKKV